MENEQIITVEKFCEHYNIEISFINALTEFGLMEIITIESKPFIYKEDFAKIEKLMHLHYELNINMEGIDAILHLLHKVDQLQSELNTVKNRLRLYEPE